jgi:hypothetical protein
VEEEDHTERSSYKISFNSFATANWDNFSCDIPLDLYIDFFSSSDV